MTLRTALAAALLVLLTGCAEDPAPVADDTAREKPAGRDRDRDRSPDEPATSADPAPAESTVAVYYIGDTERAGPRLYREFQRVSGEPLDATVEVLTGTPHDPDYRSAWSAGQISSASYDGDVISVVVDPAVRTRPSGMSRAEARAAVEQVVFTTQAAVQERAPVQFRTTENPIDTVLGVPTSEPVTHGSMLGVLSHVSLTSPEQGSAVSDGTLEVSGVGNSFEANLGWEIRRGDEVVKDGFATMEGWMDDRLFPFELGVDVADLAPGDYTFWVTTDDPTGGTEGIGAMTDDKQFSIG